VFYNYILETHRVSSIYSVVAVIYIQFVLHILLLLILLLLIYMAIIGSYMACAANIAAE
jgi:hypothetical protein